MFQTLLKKIASELHKRDIPYMIIGGQAVLLYGEPRLGPANQLDRDWVGWPRMFIKDNIGYAFYTGGGQVGLRTIPIDQLTNWESEGGITIDMLAVAAPCVSR